MQGNDDEIEEKRRATRRTFLGTLSAAGVFGLSQTTASATGNPRSAAPPQGDTDVPSLEPTNVERVSELSDRLLEFSFENPLVDPPLETANVRVLLPEGYDETDKTYPTMYLLHGGGNSAASWSDPDLSPGEIGPGPVQNYVDEDVVVVMPDGGEGGWYTDWYNDGDFGAPMWETFHIHQLVPWAEDRFRLRSERGSRVVAGLSMGSAGALQYAARYPDVFAGVYAFSGGPFPIEQLQSDAEDGELGSALANAYGDPFEQETRVRGLNPNDLTENYRNLRLYMAVGKGEGRSGPAAEIEAVAYENFLTFVENLDETGIDYTFDVFPEGVHDWPYWQKYLKRVLPDIMDVFASGPVDPSGFTHKTILRDFDIWGWQIDREDRNRRTAEFLTLEDVTSDGLTITGRGKTVVTTPGDYESGQKYRLNHDGGSATVRPRVVRADEDGRLTFAVHLGPAAEPGNDVANQPESATISIEPFERGRSNSCN
ncbi:alpha/beta hydrolase [Halomicrobium salinisoli]|uniref:alpha/beta hydrolase n=1 Tax=Halomicrobium salinisoli TaxID=2878391 RepID=UPI001CF01ED3|nr:alpha/beta hydrolase family protein [Halomicrobium salinisoli]